VPGEIIVKYGLFVLAGVLVCPDFILFTVLDGAEFVVVSVPA
jgi:hypothetical protein